MNKQSNHPDTERPNVVFILTDDQQFDTIRALGNANIHTPNLDHLVQRGVSFTRAYIMGGNSPAVCCPSRAMLHTGRSLFRTGHDNVPTYDGRSKWGWLGEEYETMPETFRKAGYRTFATGKQHNGPGVIARGFTDAEALLFGGMGFHMGLNLQDFDPSGNYRPERGRKISRFSTEIFTDATLRFLNRVDDNEPFFAYVAYTAPHDPLMVPERCKKLYDPENMALPDTFLPEHPFDRSPKGDTVRPLQSSDECVSDAVVKYNTWPIDEANMKKLLALYYGMISHIDEQVGKIIDALDKKGVLDNTVIVFAGDNGIAMGRHGCYHKQTNYDHDVHVPLLISGPGIPENKKSDALTYLYDCFPTLCDCAGIAAPDSVEGESLMPLINGTVEHHRDSLYFAYMNNWRGFFDGRYKLLAYACKNEDTEKVVSRTLLYDLVEDPHECNDLASDPRYASVPARLQKEFVKQRDAFDDPAGATTFWEHYTPSAPFVNSANH